MTTLKRVDVHVQGVVHGVGFRPFVRSLANRLGLAGRVRNDADGVFIEIEGAQARVAEFLTALERDAPARSEIARVTVVSSRPDGYGDFTITTDTPTGSHPAPPSPPPTAPPGTTAHPNRPTRPAADTAAPSSMAPTGGPAAPSSPTPPTAAS